MSRELALHWPEVGIENGEFVGYGDEELDNPLARKVLFVAGVAAGYLHIGVILMVTITSVVLVGSATGLEFFGGSTTTAVIVMAGITVAVDELLGRVGLAPLKFTAGAIAVAFILPVAVAYARLRRQSESVEHPETLAAAAGSGQATLRFIASRVLRRPRNRRITDGGRQSR
jgi:hypothetical protein